MKSSGIRYLNKQITKTNMKTPLIMRKSVEGKIARGFLKNRCKMYSMYVLGGVTVGAFGFVYVNSGVLFVSHEIYIDNTQAVTVEKVETTEETIRRVAGSFPEVETLVKIAFCESSFDRLAENKVSTAKGIFQIMNVHGLTAIERFNVETSTKWAVNEVTKNGFKAWASSKICWSK